MPEQFDINLHVYEHPNQEPPPWARELKRMLGRLPLRGVRVRTESPAGEYMCASRFKPLNWLYRGAVRLAGTRPAYPVTGYNRKLIEKHKPAEGGIEFSGNPLGFFHCISAKKAI